MPLPITVKDPQLREVLEYLEQRVPLEGRGSPENVVRGRIGQQYTNLNGGANTTLYVKESGDGTMTGWIAK